MCSATTSPRFWVVSRARGRRLADCRFNFQIAHSVIASEAKQSILSSRGEMDCFAALAMTEANALSHTRGARRPKFCISLSLPEFRAQGKPGTRCTRGLACNRCEKHAHEHTGSAVALRLSLRNDFTAYFVLAPVTGLLATVITR